MADTTNARRTITLTDRPPVIISDDKWPLVASASDKEFDNQYEFQANRISKWFVGVRQHEDGRTIVYATYSYSSNWQNSRDYAAKRGVLLDACDTADDNDIIIRALREVSNDIASAECDGDDAARWPTLVADCIADMPAMILHDGPAFTPPSAHEAAVKIADTVDIMLQVATGVQVPHLMPADNPEKVKYVKMFEAIIEGR